MQCIKSIYFCVDKYVSSKLQCPVRAIAAYLIYSVGRKNERTKVRWWKVETTMVEGRKVDGEKSKERNNDDEMSKQLWWPQWKWHRNFSEISPNFTEISMKTWNIGESHQNYQISVKSHRNLTKIFKIPVKYDEDCMWVFFSEISVNFTWKNNWSLMLKINKLS